MEVERKTWGDLWETVGSWVSADAVRVKFEDEGDIDGIGMPFDGKFSRVFFKLDVRFVSSFAGHNVIGVPLPPSLQVILNLWTS
jgi:hypothetical protein